MAWTPLLFPLFILCTGAAFQPCPQAQAPQDPGLGLPQTQSSAQAQPQSGTPPCEWVLHSQLLSHPLLQAPWPPMS